MITVCEVSYISWGEKGASQFPEMIAANCTMRTII